MPQIEAAGRRSAIRLSLRQTRLACGLVLFAYATLHFANHALGNISVDAMERGLALQKLIWQSTPGAILLYAALAIHSSLGFWALYERRQFRWTRMEATQLALGLSIPFLLATHLIGTRVALSLFGTDKGYDQELYKLWAGPPPDGALQAVLLLVVWIHGCIGVDFWLKLKPGYARAKNLLLSFAVLLPTLALLGYYQGGRQILRLAENPAWRAAKFDSRPRRNPGSDRPSRPHPQRDVRRFCGPSRCGDPRPRASSLEGALDRIDPAHLSRPRDPDPAGLERARG